MSVLADAADAKPFMADWDFAPETEGSKGARRRIGRKHIDFQDPTRVLADAARSGSSIGIEICLSGRKDRFGIDKTTERRSARNHF